MIIEIDYQGERMDVTISVNTWQFIDTATCVWKQLEKSKRKV